MLLGTAMGGDRAQRKARLEAFDAVVSALEAPLLRYASRIANNAAMAEDIVQNAFVKLIRAWKGDFENTPELSAWLYRAVHNEAVDLIRSEERRRRLHMEHGGEAMARPGQGEGEPTEAGAVAAEALGMLSAKEREIVVLKIYEEKSYREIAGIMGLSTDNVGVTLHGAMKKLAAILDRKGVQP